MTKRSKSKKHHGAKDPEKQKKARESKIKLKINNRPDNEDQAIPKSLKNLMKVRNEIRNGTFNQSINKPSKNPKNPDMKGLLDSTKHTTFEGPKLPGMNKPLKPIPVFKQNPGEHKRSFFYRMDQTIQSMKKRAEFENKYKVDVQMDQMGQSKVVEREKDEVELEIEKNKNAKLARKGIIVRSKEEKRKARREKERRRKNKNKTDENVDFNDFKDHISFGERVDAPPTLKFKKFTKTPSSKPASEGKSDLLLKKNLKHGVKKAKLSMAQKVAVEKDRQHVVELYRQIKAKK